MVVKPTLIILLDNQELTSGLLDKELDCSPVGFAAWILKPGVKVETLFLVVIDC